MEWRWWKLWWKLCGFVAQFKLPSLNVMPFHLLILTQKSQVGCRGRAATLISTVMVLLWEWSEFSRLFFAALPHFSDCSVPMAIGIERGWRYRGLSLGPHSTGSDPAPGAHRKALICSFFCSISQNLFTFSLISFYLFWFPMQCHAHSYVFWV